MCNVQRLRRMSLALNRESRRQTTITWRFEGEGGHCPSQVRQDTMIKYNVEDRFPRARERQKHVRGVRNTVTIAVQLVLVCKWWTYMSSKCPKLFVSEPELKTHGWFNRLNTC